MITFALIGYLDLYSNYGVDVVLFIILSATYTDIKIPIFFYCEFIFILLTARYIGINERRWNDQNYPTLVSSFEDTIIWDIAVGSEFILALDSKGDVWAWGSNTEGQLGLAHTDPQPVPIRVPQLQGHGIAQISAGRLYSIIVY